MFSIIGNQLIDCLSQDSCIERYAKFKRVGGGIDGAGALALIILGVLALTGHLGSSYGGWAMIGGGLFTALSTCAIAHLDARDEHATLLAAKVAAKIAYRESYDNYNQKEANECYSDWVSGDEIPSDIALGTLEIN